MEPPSSPRLGRRARYDSFSHTLHFPDPNYSPHRHPPLASSASHPAGPTNSGIPRNQFFELRLGHVAGDISYFPSTHRSNPSGFDPRDLPFPRVSDRAFERGLSDAKYSMPEVLERGRAGIGAFDGAGTFDKGPDRLRPYDGHPDRVLDSRRGQEPGQDRYLGFDSEWKRQRPVRFCDERESRYRGPYLEHLPPITDPLPSAPPPFPSPRGLRGTGSVKNSVGDASRVSVYRHTPSSPCFIGGSSSDAKVVKGTEAMAGNSQIFGKGPSLQRVQSSCKKMNNDRNGPSDYGLEGRQYAGHKSIKRSDPINVVSDDAFWSGHHIIRKTSSIPSRDTEHEFEEDCYTGYNGKRKMTSNKDPKYSANSAKRSMLKPSAFSRIQSGLSVWERLEEKLSILSPPRSLSFSPPRISNEAEIKAHIFDRSFQSNTPVTKVLDPFSAETSSIKDKVSVEKPKRVTKKNMPQTIKKVIIPAVASFDGSSRKSNRVAKKKKKKYTVQPREKVVIPIVSSSPGSIAKQGVVRDFKLSSPGGVLVPEANIAELSSCRPESKSMSSDWTKKVKKLAEDKRSRAEEAAKMFGQVDCCIIKTQRMEDSTEIPKLGAVFSCAEEESNSAPNVESITEPVGSSHSQICQKIQKNIASPTNIVSANIISTVATQAQDTFIEILDDSGKDSLEQSKKLDTIYQCSSDFDVNVCSQPSGHIIDGHAAHDSFVNLDENIVTNSIKQIKSVNSQKLGQGMLPADNAASPQVLCSDTSLKLEGEVRHREEISIATKELEVPGNFCSPQSRIHGPHVPSFSDISNSIPEQKLHSEETGEEYNMLPQYIYNMTFQDSVDTLAIDSCGKNTGQALLLGPIEKDIVVTHFENVSHSNPEQSHIGNGNPEHSSKGESILSSIISQASEPGDDSGKTILNHQFIPEKAQLLPSYQLKEKVAPNPKLTGEELSCKKTSPLADVQKFLSNKLNFSVSLKEAARASQTGRHRTWVRSNAPSLNSVENLKQGGILSKQLPKRLDKTQNSSYFRKGNSLIRKLGAEPSPSVIPIVGCSSRKFKSSAREIRSESSNIAAHSDLLFEGLKTLLPPLSEPSVFSMNSCKDFPQFIPIDRSPEPGTDQEIQHNRQSTGLVGCKVESSLDTASSKIAGAKRLIYVKRKRNQLVAAPGPEIGNSSKFHLERSQKSVHHPIEMPKKMPLSSYLYHRSKKNQLIRNETSSDSKLTGIPAGNTNSVDSPEPGSILSYKKRLDNVLQRKKNPTTSLVWTLGGDTLSQKCIATFGCQRVFPYIFPWKRSVNWRNFMAPNSNPISARSSISLISRNLQSLRKRDTIYKVSTNGFALRKAGVVSIGGSSLKWSKSIEKRSKMASEEATLAVAEVERKKRERKRSKSTTDKGKKKVQLTCRSISGIELKRGERIFRVGSVRYKMDASMRTLSRMPDDNSTSFASQKLGNSSRIPFIPRRLIIGNNEYVGIGNGNQLIRDPKRLKRTLANEKVRWSLHSARLRLAQKSQFCLFFTRFGECNKSGRRCPYIHDSTKVAICTKFLKDECSATHCKLTHKVIPERMPDCAYFLKGMCTNINCPYRHVKVNANAPLCDGFLRGHCADGDECRKKHSYTCPLFEATGSCPQGSLCKLHHPKNKSKSKKRKRSQIQNSSHGRYFYSVIGKEGSAEPVEVPSSQNDLEGDNDIFCSDGRFTEYINLADDDDIVAIKNDRSYTGELDSGYLDFQSGDIDALINPIRIINGDELTIF